MRAVRFSDMRPTLKSIGAIFRELFPCFSVGLAYIPLRKPSFDCSVHDRLFDNCSGRPVMLPPGRARLEMSRNEVHECDESAGCGRGIDIS